MFSKDSRGGEHALTEGWKSLKGSKKRMFLPRFDSAGLLHSQVWKCTRIPKKVFCLF